MLEKSKPKYSFAGGSGPGAPSRRGNGGGARGRRHPEQQPPGAIPRKPSPMYPPVYGTDWWPGGRRRIR